jgi:N-acetylglucosaminyldiphosphoundecaprenol N-acetyl-beta-D-mannosaminyltransferase
MTTTLRPAASWPHTDAAPAPTYPARTRGRVRIGELWMDALTFAEALDEIAALVAAGRGGSVLTPNVDHIVTAESHAGLREAYRRASLSLVDGMPVLWAARLLGTPLPEKVSGSDLVMPLMRRAAAEGWRVYLVGGAPGVAAEAAEKLRRQCGVNVVGHDAPMVRADGSSQDEASLVRRIERARPHLVLVALGAPKQEMWIERMRATLGAAVAVGVGASLDFVVGRVKRAPVWMSRVGLEWLYRLASEPRRLWRRYLLRDPQFLFTVLRTMREPRARRLSRVERSA